MIKRTFNEAFRLLHNSWLRVIGIVLLVYFIKVAAGTLPISGTVVIEMNPFYVLTSNTLTTLLFGALLNSILFFIMIDYILLSQHTMRRRFVTACSYPFRNPKLLYKGVIVLAISYLLLHIIGMMSIYAVIGSLFTASVGFNIRLFIVLFIYLLIFALIIWLYLGISQSLYILYDDPDISVFRSIKRSFFLMKGARWSLIGFIVLSFIGMIIGTLLLVVTGFIILVIYEVGRLAFYQTLLQRKRQKEWQDKIKESN
ncbi:hypothetical protein AJ85_01540 [Alkalihalobacillus alcalophilus ATCC 27647 = CGMCC 1.3604]|uniref:DUF975 family protein n=1 Tax=Alkalihalobacillus alcalophilus ATCC 27647 = CGMCC 1.3604 TaxID=1218173 RepID=A0A094YTI8_ALKAL|nr:DUF975 family protein [Alkalihalobacillus alcalophilus]KGA96757.1 hypothetical protein BALCAV_0214170 [Alkalihalobacillus alcalophilus ATCC 27647 = CGMCC 1.3604]MED1561786.1 DUF975 family protein [Alkalihalobacillus alcalophilus]THG91801.1 hypothetical protein AJ85_01540 [Alkalihalobacillus alcalophilus ATCC 27647 = CGMCC 1.3604]